MTPTVIPAIFLAKDRMTSKIEQMQSKISRFASTTAEKFDKAGQAAFKVGRQTAMVGAFVAAPLVLAAKTAVDFEEKMADVAKTTGMEGKTLTDFGDKILEMSTKTRTSIDDLTKIAEIGGQLGVAQKDLVSFTQSANKFSIALGSDFSGGVEEAVASVSKIKSLFSDTRNLNISDAILATGSAINELGAVGNGTSANITDFALRIGALPDSLKGTSSATLALGAYLEEMGIDSQIAAGGVSNLLLVAGKNIGGFAARMKMSGQEAKDLLANDPTQFASKFALAFKGMAPDKLATELEKLKIGSQETIKVIGALGSDQIDAATGMNRITTLTELSNKATAEKLSLDKETAKKEATAAAQMAKLKNNAQALAITVGQALLPVINDLVSAIMPYVKSAADWIRQNRGLVSTIVKVAAVVAGLAFAISGFSFAVGVAQKAMVLFGAASKVALGPIRLIVAAVGTAIYLYSKLSNTIKSTASAEELATSVKERALEKSIDQRVEVMQLFETMRKAKEGTEAYSTALSRVEEMQPGITEKYNLQRKSVEALSRAEKDLTNSIMARAMEEARAEIIKEKIKEAVQRKEAGAGWVDSLVATQASYMSWMADVTGVGGKAKSYTGEDVVNADVNSRMREAETLSKMSVESANPQNSENGNNNIKEVRLVVNGNEVGTLGGLQGKETPVQAFGRLTPSMNRTR